MKFRIVVYINKWISFVGFMAFLAILYSCVKGSDLTSGEPHDENPQVEEIIPTGDERYLNLKSGYIFDQSKLHTFELTLTSSALAKIDANPTAEEYVEGSLSFEGETISLVGIRYKGSVGAFVNCLSGNDWTNPSGRKTCTKLSMKIKLNWRNPDTRFYGLKKLQFHSQNLDDSQMRERLGYWLFRQMEVPAPRSVHARLLINGSYIGVYALTEQIDGRFTRFNFEDGSGNLYKEIWPIDQQGKPYSPQVYLNHLKTNEDENPSVEMIRNFGDAISNSNDSEMMNVITQWMDIEKIISFAVVDRMIRNDDGPFHWYCNSGNCNNHNYYWYEDPSEVKMQLIPWDLDNAFENIIRNQNPVTPIADEWGMVSANCNPFRYGSFGLIQRSASCDKLIAGWTLFEEEYLEIKKRFKEGPFSEIQVNEMLNSWETQISSATQEASQLHNDAISVDQWKQAIENLKEALEFARTN